MTIDLNDLIRDMIAAAKAVLDESWSEVSDNAETEFKAIAEGIVLIQKLRLEGKISKKQARRLIKVKRKTAKIVLISIGGQQKIAVQNAINAALEVVKVTVNNALNFTLL